MGPLGLFRLLNSYLTLLCPPLFGQEGNQYDWSTSCVLIPVQETEQTELNSNTNSKREGHREHEQRKGKEGAGGAESEGERGREGKRDFFSSCKPFQLCSGLRTETGRERRGSAHFNKRTGKERRGTGNVCHFVPNEIRRREQDKCDEAETEGLLVKTRKTLVCKVRLGLELNELSGSLPSGYTPTTRQLSCLPFCLPGWSKIHPPPPPPIFELLPDAVVCLPSNVFPETVND